MKRIIIFSIFILPITACNKSETKQEKINKALQEGKVVVYKPDGSFEITDDKNKDFEKLNALTQKNNALTQKNNEMSMLTDEEMKLIKTLGIDVSICFDLKKITKKPFSSIKVVNQTGKEISPEMTPKLIENKNITSQEQKAVEEYLKQNGFREMIHNNWTNYTTNVYFTDNGENKTMLIGCK